jgi:hypothetical protein
LTRCRKFRLDAGQLASRPIRPGRTVRHSTALRLSDATRSEPAISARASGRSDRTHASRSTTVVEPVELLLEIETVLDDLVDDIARIWHGL